MICHLCKLPIPPWATHDNHPLHYSRDHVIPRSRGGLGLPFNKWPAHICCNSFRRDMDITLALRKRCRRIARKEFHRAPDQVLADLHQIRTWSHDALAGVIRSVRH